MDFPVFDAHVDLGYMLRTRLPETRFQDLTRGPVTPSSLRRGNVRVLVNAFYTPDKQAGPERGARYLQGLLDHAQKTLNGFAVDHGLTGVETALKDPTSPPALLFMVENADPLLEFPLERLKNLGVRVVGLTHAGASRIADGNGVRTPKGFTREGLGLLGRLAAHGFAVDVAHLSRPALDQLPDLFEGPLCATHTGFSNFLDLPRNLTKTGIRTVLDHNGVIGLALAPEILDANRQADLELVLAHIDWFCQNFGPEGLGLGTDFCGFEETTAGLEDAGRLPDLAERLLKIGYRDEQVAAIFSTNWVRFYTSLFFD